MFTDLIVHGTVRLTRDPKVTRTTNGTQVAEFGVAHSSKFKDQERKWFGECKCFGRLAERSAGLHKGNAIHILGTLQTDEWPDREGKKVSHTRVILSTWSWALWPEEKQALIPPQANGPAQSSSFLPNSRKSNPELTDSCEDIPF